MRNLFIIQVIIILLCTLIGNASPRKSDEELLYKNENNGYQIYNLKEHKITFYGGGNSILKKDMVLQFLYYLKYGAKRNSNQSKIL